MVPKILVHLKEIPLLGSGKTDYVTLTRVANEGANALTARPTGLPCSWWSRPLASCGAPRLIPISFAHIDACFYTGQSHVDFVRFFLEHDAKLAVPTWTNNSVASPDDGGLRPEHSDPEMVRGAHELMRLYAQLGCKPTWTCAPYQLAGGPKFGDQIAVGESNAVAYYNSVIGARTNKYGDYLDVACAITGLAPFAGLHTDEGRKADIHFSCASIPDEWKRQDIFFHLLGHFIGRKAGRRIPSSPIFQRKPLPINSRPYAPQALPQAVLSSCMSRA